MINIAIQSFLRPALTAVPHCQDYAVFRDTLERIDRLLMDSSLERQATEMALEDFAQASVKQQHNRAQMAIRALRMEVLRFLLGGISFRHLARSLGSSDLLASSGERTAYSCREIEGIIARIDRMSEEFFGWLQRRRGGLEGRIATVKNHYHSGRLRAKGFTNRNLATGWSVLSHNLWLIAKTLALEAQQRQSRRKNMGRYLEDIC